MTAGDWLSMTIIGVSIVALYVQLKRLGQTLRPRRFVQVVTLVYFICINILALTTTDLELVRTGILSRIGVIILLFTVILDKGDC